MRKHKVLSILILFLTLVVSGCNGNSNEEMTKEEVPQNVHSTFLFFKEEKASEGESVGSLYIKKKDAEVSLIGNDVLNYAVYDNDTEQVLYLDSDSTLFKYTDSDEPPEKIDSNVEVMSFSDTPDKKVVYYTDDDSVYVYDDSKTEKIGSNIYSLDLFGNDVYYTDHDSNLYSYNIETRAEERITSGSLDFQLMDNGQSIAYTDENGALYYLNLEDDTEFKVSSGWVDITAILKVNDNIYYTEGSGETADLYVANIAENSRSEIITEDVLDFKFQGNDIVYRTSDLGLYQLQEDNASKRIATDVNNFDILNNKIIYLEEDGTLFTWNQENDEEAQIGHDVSSYQYFSNGQIYYLTTDGDLFNGNVKLASDISSYNSFYNTLIYATDDSLYMITDEANEELILADEIGDYSSIYYQNQLIYENNLKLSDISGVWELTLDSDNKAYFEIKSSGEFIDLLDGETIEMEETYNGYNELTLSDGYSSLYFTREGEKYNLEIEGTVYSIKPSSQKQAEEYSARLKKEEEAAEKAKAEAEEQAAKDEEQAYEMDAAKYVVEEFIYYLPSAVNYGSFSYIADYIDESSDFYNEQFDYVMSLYDKGTQEQLKDYQIRDATMNDDGSINVKTREVFNIWNGETGNEFTSDYTATYTLKKNANQYQITNISVD